MKLNKKGNVEYMQRVELNNNNHRHSVSITTIPDHIFKEVEALMIADGEKENFVERYEKELTEEEWVKEVFDTCIHVLEYRECNGSIREAYMDFMH